jgi:hypothetical protein
LIYETDIIKLSTLRKIKHPVIKQQQPQQQQYQQQQQYNMNDPLLDTKIEYVAQQHQQEQEQGQGQEPRPSSSNLTSEKRRM